MSLYEFVIKDKNGKALATLDSAFSRSFSTYLNKSGDAHFSLSIYDAKVTQEMLQLGNKELYIYRANTLLWGGELLYSRSDMSRETQKIDVSAKGFFDLLSKRYVGTAANPRVFTNTDLADIAWTIINESQSQTDGDFGITQGTHPTTRDADRTYEYKNVKEAIEGLSNLNVQNGFDFEVGPNKKFSVFYPVRGSLRKDCQVPQTGRGFSERD